MWWSSMIMMILQILPVILLATLLYESYLFEKTLSSVDTRWSLWLNTAQCLFPIFFLQVLSRSSVLVDPGSEEDPQRTLSSRLIEWLSDGTEGWQKRNIYASIIPSVLGIIASCGLSLYYLQPSVALISLGVNLLEHISFGK